MLWGDGIADQGIFGTSLLPAGSLLSQKPPCVGLLGVMQDLIMVHVSWEKHQAPCPPWRSVSPRIPSHHPLLSVQGKQLWLKRGPLCLGGEIRLPECTGRLGPPRDPAAGYPTYCPCLGWLFFWGVCGDTEQIWGMNPALAVSAGDP